MCERAVLLCGPPGSGKTTATWYLERIGFATVNVGGVVRHICARRSLPTSRGDLEEFGRRYIVDEIEAQELVSALVAKLGAARNVAVDGIRPRRIIRLFAKRYCQAKVVYLHARPSVLVDRLKRRGMSELEAIGTLSAPLEQEAAMIKWMADLVFENEGPLYETLRAVHSIAMPARCVLGTRRIEPSRL